MLVSAKSDETTTMTQDDMTCGRDSKSFLPDIPGLLSKV